jgi:hypothetical protein
MFAFWVGSLCVGGGEQGGQRATIGRAPDYLGAPNKFSGAPNYSGVFVYMVPLVVP